MFSGCRAQFTADELSKRCLRKKEKKVAAAFLCDMYKRMMPWPRHLVTWNENYQSLRRWPRQDAVFLGPSFSNFVLVGLHLDDNARYVVLPTGERTGIDFYGSPTSRTLTRVEDN